LLEEPDELVARHVQGVDAWNLEHPGSAANCPLPARASAAETRAANARERRRVVLAVGIGDEAGRATEQFVEVGFASRQLAELFLPRKAR
jgi:hypothetical protein